MWFDWWVGGADRGRVHCIYLHWERGVTMDQALPGRYAVYMLRV
jgi:hypothetical protein